MSSNYRNYNVAYKLFLEAVGEFESFIPGIDTTKTSAPLPQVPFGFLTKTKAELREKVSEQEKKAREKRLKQRRFAQQLFDRTTGMYFLKDMSLALSAPGTLPGAGTIANRKYVSFVHTGEPFASAVNQDDSTFNSSVHKDYLSPNSFCTMNHVVSQVDPTRVTRKSVVATTDSSADAASDANLESGEKKYKVDWSALPSHKSKANHEIHPDVITNSNTANPHRFNHPSLGAVVIKDPSMNFSARGSNHLPIFLNAVTPVEMSRCAVYIDFRIVSTDQRDKAARLNSVNFLGFPGDNEQYDMFKINEPVGSEAVSSDDYRNANTYMDVFTSPQTMVNGNSDSKLGGLAGMGLDAVLGALEETSKSRLNMYNKQGVIDKFQPFMSLLSADVRITGAGAALLSTKTATVRLKLHDKSRISDLTPLLSVDSFGFTKVYLEFGWSHPDSSFTSRNTIGKFLDGMRDVSTYTVKNASYTFGDDNSADITLELASIGSAQAQAVHAGAGSHGSLRMYQDLIHRCFSVAKEGLDPNSAQHIKIQKDLRSKLLVTSRNAGSINQLVPFQKIQAVNKKYVEVTEDKNITKPEAKALLATVLDAFGMNGAAVIGSASSSTTFMELLSSTDGELGENASRAGNLVFAKLLASTTTLDPFQTACVTNSDVTETIIGDPGGVPGNTIPGLIGFDGSSPKSYSAVEKEGNPHVSLGKLICQFVGYPLATCGLYDEVQVYFYPVNNHAAAARKHTTASLPIPYQRVEEAFRKILGSAGKNRLKNNLTVQGAFRVFDDICGDRTLPAYGIYSNSASMREFKDFKKKTYDQKKTAAYAGLATGGAAEFQGKSEGDIKTILDASRGWDEDHLNNLAIRAYEKQLLEKHTQELSGILKSIYGKKNVKGKDGYKGYSVADRFTPVNLSMFLETAPAVKASAMSHAGDLAGDIALSALGSAGHVLLRDKLYDKGLHREKQIMRIHIYDQAATHNPELLTWFTRTNDDSAVVGESIPNEQYNALKERRFSYWKSFARSFYPSIIHGTNTGTVLGVTVSSQTSGDLGNVMLVDAYEQARGMEPSQNQPNFDETVIFPSVIKLELMGNPTISRGQEIFIDFGTNTSLDNVYVVDNVYHELKAGQFTTTCEMTVANQGLVSSIRSKTIAKVRAMQSKLT